MHDGVMNGWKRVAGWVLFGVALVGLGVYLIAADLDRADKLASVIGGLSAVAGLAISIYGLTRQPVRHSGQSVSDSYIGGDVVRKTSRPDPGPQDVTRSTVLGSVHDLETDRPPSP